MLKAHVASAPSMGMTGNGEDEGGPDERDGIWDGCSRSSLPLSEASRARDDNKDGLGKCTVAGRWAAIDRAAVCRPSCQECSGWDSRGFGALDVSPSSRLISGTSLVGGVLKSAEGRNIPSSGMNGRNCAALGGQGTCFSHEGARR